MKSCIEYIGIIINVWMPNSVVSVVFLSYFENKMLVFFFPRNLRSNCVRMFEIIKINFRNPNHNLIKDITIFILWLFQIIFQFKMVLYAICANNIHLLTGYEGNITFIVPKVTTIFRGNAEENSWYRGDN